MAALFLLALVLIGWQAARTRPLRPAPLAMAWQGGEQVFPIAAPSWEGPAVLPQEPRARYQALLERSVLWPGAAASGTCEAFIRTSASTWVRRGIDPKHLTASTARYAARDFLDDDDGDGDALDAGELARSGTGAEVEVFCPS